MFHSFNFKAVLQGIDSKRMQYLQLLNSISDEAFLLEFHSGLMHAILSVYTCFEAVKSMFWVQNTCLKSVSKGCGVKMACIIQFFFFFTPIEITCIIHVLSELSVIYLNLSIKD